MTVRWNSDPPSPLEGCTAFDRTLGKSVALVREEVLAL